MQVKLYQCKVLRKTSFLPLAIRQDIRFNIQPKICFLCVAFPPLPSFNGRAEICRQPPRTPGHCCNRRSRPQTSPLSLDMVPAVKLFMLRGQEQGDGIGPGPPLPSVCGHSSDYLSIRPCLVHCLSQDHHMQEMHLPSNSIRNPDDLMLDCSYHLALRKVSWASKVTCLKLAAQISSPAVQLLLDSRRSSEMVHEACWDKLESAK